LESLNDIRLQNKQLVPSNRLASFFASFGARHSMAKKALTISTKGIFIRLGDSAPSAGSENAEQSYFLFVNPFGSITLSRLKPAVPSDHCLESLNGIRLQNKYAMAPGEDNVPETAKPISKAMQFGVC
jgi:hypothetical protein